MLTIPVHYYTCELLSLYITILVHYYPCAYYPCTLLSLYITIPVHYYTCALLYLCITIPVLTIPVHYYPCALLYMCITIPVNYYPCALRSLCITIPVHYYTCELLSLCLLSLCITRCRHVFESCCIIIARSNFRKLYVAHNRATVPCRLLVCYVLVCLGVPPCSGHGDLCVGRGSESLRAGGAGNRTPVAAIFSTQSRPALGPTQTPTQCVLSYCLG